MKIGLIRETKTPEDNRVALTPSQIKELQEKYNDTEFYVQCSTNRSYKDQEYRDLGISTKEDISDCDILFGIKEADITTLSPGKHYFFFGHLAKMQPYNKPLLKKMMELGVTFSDYEYLVDEKGERVCAFGWWAGIVGVYNTLRAYGLKNNLFELKKPDSKFTLDLLLERLCVLRLPAIKIVLTGKGRVSQGAYYILNKMRVKEIAVENYLNSNENEACFCVVGIEQLVRRDDAIGEPFNREHFRKMPHLYSSDFRRFSEVSDVLISCHSWLPGQPVYLTETDLANTSNRIKVIGDITCDILGSIKSTLRASTHSEPFYDYNPRTAEEEKAFSKTNGNITIMAVDTCPNALALDTSRYFGEMLAEHVFPQLLQRGSETSLIQRATILRQGELTKKYDYLKDFAGLK